MKSYTIVLNKLTITRLSVIIAIFISFSMLTSAQTINLRKITYTVQNLMRIIEKQTNKSVDYGQNTISTDKVVTVSSKELSLQSLLNQMLQGTNLGYTISDRHIIITKNSDDGVRQRSAQPKKRVVTGKVTDSNGDAIIGVAVRIKGQSTGVITDLDGNYSIPADNKDVLEFSYVGNTPQVIQADRSVINVTLVEDSNQLNEVVVVGYGTQKKVNLTGSVASVDFSKEASRPVTTASEALAGLAAGVQVLQSSGQPNTENVGILIRGSGTLNDSSPLVLVDGMEMSLSDVDPNSIASVSILKDAASCAIYGNRGANGVILVTTKTGTEGQVRVSYSGKFSIDTPTRLVPFVSNYADYMGFINEAGEQMGYGKNGSFSEASIQQWRDAEADPNGTSASGYPNYVAYPNTNWYDAIYQTKVMQEHTLSVLGKEKRADYNITMTFLDNPGLIVNTGMKKYSLNANITSDITDWLQVGAHAWGYHTDQDRNDVGNLTAWNFLKATPGMYPYYDGKYGGQENNEDDPSANNPLAFINSNGDSFYKYTNIYTTAHVQIKFLHDFTFKTVFGYNYYQTHQKYEYLGTKTYSFSRNVELLNQYTNLSDVNVFDYNRSWYNWKLTSTLNWAHTFNKVHDVSALVGFEEGKNGDTYTDTEKQGIVDPSITDLNAVTNMMYINGNRTGYTYRSWFGRINYAYDSKYLFEADMRYDGSSRFAPDHRWGFFPGLSAAWRVSEENFAKNSFLSVFDNLKIRASWGKLGNNSVDNYAWQSMYTMTYTDMNNQRVPAFYQGVLPNPVISWEKTRTTDIGIDFGILHNHLTGTIDYYDKNTSGILYRPDTYATLGEKTPALENLATVNNRGVEITLGWNDGIKDFTYGVSANATFNHNRVTKYKGALEQSWTTDANGNTVYNTNLGNVSTGGDQLIVEGHAMNEWFLYQTYHGNGQYFNSDGSVNINGGPKDGMIRTENDMKWLNAMIAAGHQFLPDRTVGKNGIWYGDYIFADIDKDGVYGDGNDRKFENVSSDPKINIGFQAHAEWKGFDLSMNWGAALGFKTYWWEVGQDASSVVYGLQLPELQAYNHYFYDPDNPSDPRTNITSANPRLVLTNPSQSDALHSNLYLYNCDFLKLRNLTFGYTLPKAIANKIYAQNIRVYFSGENLLTITPFKGMDPEMRAGDGYAIMRQIAFGLNVTF